MKWLAAAAVAIVIAALLLWRQMGDDAEVIPQASAKVTPTTEMATTPTERARDERVKAAAKLAEEVKAEAAKPADEEKPKKVDPMSDEFFYKLPERVPKMLGQAAAKCYEGIAKRVHRNENVVYDFKTKVKDGVVTISDVKVNRSSISQPALETCFRTEIGHVTWNDDTLPDWEGDDQLTISPERGLKKFMQDNINYVGDTVHDGYDVKPHKADTQERGSYDEKSDDN